MTRLWFRARTHGWGWSPASLEGWVVVAAFLVLVAAGTAVFLYRLRAGSDAGIAGALFVLWIAALGSALTAIAWTTGEPPHWRW